MISVSVAVLQMKGCYAMITNIVPLTFFRNFYPSVNNNSSIKSMILNNGIYPTKKANNIHVYSVLK